MAELTPEQAEFLSTSFCGVYMNDKVSLCGKPVEDYIVIEENGNPVFLPFCSEHSHRLDTGEAFLVRAKDSDKSYAIELKVEPTSDTLESPTAIEPPAI